MTDPRGVHSAHLDAAEIAALVDRTLDPAARAAAEAHLSGCAECREVWMETSDIASDTEVGGWAAAPATADAPAARGRSRRWIYGGAGLAIAAALALVVVSPRMFDRGDRPELRRLVEAVGTNRTTEARLTGGFQWGPVPSVTRGEPSTRGANADMAVAELRRRAERGEDADVLAAWGTGLIVTGHVNEGTAALRRSLEADATRANVWSDLAGAYLETYRLHGDLAALPPALDAARRALELAPESAEARFNRALALTHLGRREDARRAWNQYLQIDGSSPWADEARRRSEQLR